MSLVNVGDDKILINLVAPLAISLARVRAFGVTFEEEFYWLLKQAILLFLFLFFSFLYRNECLEVKLHKK